MKTNEHAIRFATGPSALREGCGLASPQDGESIRMDALRHFFILNYEADAKAKASETIDHFIRRNSSAGLRLPWNTETTPMKPVST
jgi:hypothetical protein